MSSGTVYEESVASFRAPTPLCSSPRAAAAAVVPDAPRLPVRRHLDFPGGGDLDDDDDFLYHAADVMERSLYESQRCVAEGLSLTALPHTPPFPEKQCICGRGPCDVVWRVPGHWAYVCSAPPVIPPPPPSRKKCKYSARCEESDRYPNSHPACWSHPEPNNHHAFNTPSNHRACTTTRVNVSPQGAYATVPVNVSPQAPDATAPVNFSPQRTGTATPVNFSTGARTNGEWPNSQPAFWSHPEPNNHHVFNTASNYRACATTRVNVSPQGAYSTVPVNVSPQGAGAATPVHINTGSRSNSEWPTCKCTAGKCKISKVKGVEYYVCPIPKGQGACAHRELVNAGAEEAPQTRNNNAMKSKHLDYNPVMKDVTGLKMGKNNETRPVNLDQPEDDEWQFLIVGNDIVDLRSALPSPATAIAQGSSMLHQPIAMVGLETPTKSPVPSKFTVSPTTPRSGSCYVCREDGHWAVHCPKKDVCFHCAVAGHWKTDCPELHNKRGF